MIPIRLAAAALALAILAVSTPTRRSDAADNQVTEMPDGLKYTDTNTVDGATARAANKVSVHYTGWQTGGKRFDSSVEKGQPVSFGLDEVIKGWTEGVQLMVEGEKTRFWIPDTLAYKDQPQRPPGMLVFDIELISTK